MQEMTFKGREELSKLFQQAIDYNGGADPVYIGYAHPGAATSAASWMIMKITYTNGNVTAIKYASGLTSPSFVWDNRTTYTYS